MFGPQMYRTTLWEYLMSSVVSCRLHNQLGWDVQKYHTLCGAAERPGIVTERYTM